MSAVVPLNEEGQNSERKEKNKEKVVMWTLRDAEVHKFTLAFVNPALEKMFREHYNKYVVGKVRMALFFYMIVNLLFIIIEIVNPDLRDHVTTLSAFHLVDILLLLGFLKITRQNHFQQNFEKFMMYFYFLRGALLVVMFVAVVDAIAINYHNEEEHLFRPLSGRFSQTYSLIYISLCFNLSGMRLVMSWKVTIAHLVTNLIALTAMGKVASYDTFGGLIFMTVFMAFCGTSSHNSERHVRQEFVHRYNVAEDRRRRDELLDNMLPPRVKERLKLGVKDAADLMESYEQVTILFCYISGFGRISSRTHPDEMVKMLNDIYSTFDSATEIHNVYKVEAIAETYMCVSGVPQANPDHVERIADMALAMIETAYEKGWNAGGEQIRLQIGIHSGRVAAGVVGHKTYSYHLFGDTVNVSSRMCSSSLPDKIQLSPDAFRLIQQSGRFKTEERGEVIIKGKGKMTTYWLLGHAEETTKRQLNVKFKLEEETRASLSAAAQKTESEGKSHINLRTLSFSDNETEQGFVLEYNNHNVAQFRRAMFIAIIVLSAFVLNDFYVAESRNEGQNLTVRIILKAVGVLLLVCVLLYSRTARGISSMQLVGGITAILTFAHVNLVVLWVPTWNLSDTNVISVTIISLLMRLRFRTALIVNSFCLVYYLVMLTLADFHTNENVFSYITVVFVATLIGTYASYKRELGLRLDYVLKQKLVKERQKTQEVLSNTLPSSHHAELLLSGKDIVVDELSNVTLLYSDIVGFTPLSAKLPPSEVYRLLHKIYSRFDRYLDERGVYKIDTIGDAFVVVGGLDAEFERGGANLRRKSHEAAGLNMAKSRPQNHTHYSHVAATSRSKPHFSNPFITRNGLTVRSDPINASALAEISLSDPNNANLPPVPNPNHASAVVEFALDMLKEIQEIKREFDNPEEGIVLNMRIGIHTGHCLGGIIGHKKPRYLVWGENTVIANKMESEGLPGVIQVSETTYEMLVRSGGFSLVKRDSFSINVFGGKQLHTYLLQCRSNEPAIPEFTIPRNASESPQTALESPTDIEDKKGTSSNDTSQNESLK